MVGGSYRPVPDAKDGGAGSLQRVWAVLEEGSLVRLQPQNTHTSWLRDAASSPAANLVLTAVAS